MRRLFCEEAFSFVVNTMEKAPHKKLFYATIIGNVIEHYDKALFGLIAPFIAPLFFPNTDPIVALIFIYLPMGLIARPIGALYWGYIGDRFGRRQVLYFSILGMSLTLLCTGLLPTYKTLGILSACLLHFKRGLTSFFAAGEGTAAALLLLENSEQKSRDLVSSYYEMSSIFGVLMASLMITWLCFQGRILTCWRFLFIVSGLIGLIGFWLRKDSFFTEKKESKNTASAPLNQLLKLHWAPFLAITLLTGFLCANYHILTKLMNGYMPLVSSLTSTEMMATHSILILYDFFLLPFFGFLSKRIGKEKLMMYALFFACTGIFPLFNLMQNPSLNRVLFLRMALVTWGIALSAPFNFWAMSLIPKEARFRILSLAKAFGAQAIGGSAISVSLFIYHKTNWVVSPACFIFMTALSSILVMLLIKAKTPANKPV